MATIRFDHFKKQGGISSNIIEGRLDDCRRKMLRHIVDGLDLSADDIVASGTLSHVYWYIDEREE